MSNPAVSLTLAFLFMVMLLGLIVAAPPAARRVLRRPPRCPDPEGHVIETKRLVLRGPEARDRAAFLASFDEEVRRRQGYTEASLDRWEHDFDAITTQPRPGCPTWLLVFDRETRQFSGSYSIGMSTDRRWAELGWWLAPAARGRGLGSESLRAVLRYVHEHLDIPVATMGTAADNLPALRQIERAGATATDTRPHTLPNGQTVTSCWFEHRA